MESELRRARGIHGLLPAGQLGMDRGPTRTSPVCQQISECRASEKRARPRGGAGRGGAGCRPLLCLSLHLSVSPSGCHTHTPSDTCPTNRASGCVQAPPRRTKLRPSTPPPPPYLVASARVSGLPVSVHPAVLQLFCGAHHLGDRAQAPHPRLPRLIPTQPAQGSGVRRSAVHPIPLGTPTASSPCRAVGVQGAGPRLVLTQPAQGSGVRRSAVHPIPLGTPTASSPCRAVGVQGAGHLPGLHFQHGDPGLGAGPS